MIIRDNKILSKSAFMYGNQCQKRLWLHHYKPEFQDPINANQQSAFQHGNEVNELAYQLFPQGVSAKPENFYSYEESIAKTQEYIANGHEVIYEAAFQYDGVLAVIDLLVKEQGKWYAYEIKSSTQLKKKHKIDAAFQYHVITNSGVDLQDIYIVSLNKDYTYRGVINIDRLFKINFVLDSVKELQSDIVNKIKKYKEVLQSEIEPICDTGNFCNNPICNFKSYCKYNKDYSKESKVDIKQLEIFLSSLTYPLYFMDFESWSGAVPRYQHQWPYRQMPFQFSVHKQKTPYSYLEHFEYLAEYPSTSHRQFASNLIDILDTSGTILVYNKSFENTILEQLKNDFPELDNQITQIQSRLVDLMVPFQNQYYYTPEMKGSYSIKYVLPALVKNLSYQGMEISNGAAASQAFYKLQIETNSQARESIRNALLQYCKLDTLAMVEILKNIESQVRS